VLPTGQKGTIPSRLLESYSSTYYAHDTRDSKKLLIFWGITMNDVVLGYKAKSLSSSVKIGRHSMRTEQRTQVKVIDRWPSG
jgi:hypothetical protein